MSVLAYLWILHIRDDIKVTPKMNLILVLAEYGYPPVTNDEVFKEILEQAENFKKYNVW